MWFSFFLIVIFSSLLIVCIRLFIFLLVASLSLVAFFLLLNLNLFFNTTLYFFPSVQAVQETLLCMSLIAPAIKPECVFATKVTATFISPLLDATPSNLEYSVVKSSHDDLSSVEKSVKLTNVSPLPLTALLSCGSPFSLLSESRVQLDPSSSCSVRVGYNPNICSSSHSRVDSSRLEIRYVEHPHEECIALKAAVSFPNVTLQPDNVAFGCIVNNTTAHARVLVTNASSLPVRYSWSLIDDAQSSNASQVGCS